MLELFLHQLVSLGPHVGEALANKDGHVVAFTSQHADVRLACGRIVDVHRSHLKPAMGLKEALAIADAALAASSPRLAMVKALREAFAAGKVAGNTSR
jgi:hypothetical protein